MAAAMRIWYCLNRTLFSNSSGADSMSMHNYECIGLLEPAFIGRCMDALRNDYYLSPDAICPPKHIDPLSFRGDLIEAYGIAMTALLKNGSWGAKLIRINEYTNKTSSQTILFDSHGDIVVNVDSTELTRLRCALMAALSLDVYYKNREKSGLSVGFIGAGKINALTMVVFQYIFSISTFFVKPNPSNPTGGVPEFSDTRRIHLPSDLGTCDIIVECATSNLRENVIELSDVDPGVLQNNRLYIAQNSGWIFGETFRETLPSFTDHIIQINQCLLRKFDWPWDTKEVIIPYDIKDARFSYDYCPCGAIVYLTGIAIADLIIVEQARIEGRIRRSKF